MSNQKIIQESIAPQKVSCTRCGRKLKHPEYLNDVPYGSTCIKKIYQPVFVNIARYLN